MDERLSGNLGWALAIHGGAGADTEEAGAEADGRPILNALTAVLEAGAASLASGGSALDAVEDAVRRLEDSPHFNAGKGSVYNGDAEHELEASIMDGRTLDAGAAAVLHGVRNPIRLARLVMERSPHVFLQGEGALELARLHGLELVGPEYFGTERRRIALERERQRAAAARPGAPAENGSGTRPGAPPLTEPDHGTVGAVARDLHGDLAAGTSTGGLTNKAPGRVGDSSIIGAGTFASNASCAVSCTGQGELFIRATAARDVAALIEYRGISVQAALEEVVHRRVASLGGKGGVIAVDGNGRIAFACNTDLMLHGSVSSTSPPSVSLRFTPPGASPTRRR